MRDALDSLLLPEHLTGLEAVFSDGAKKYSRHGYLDLPYCWSWRVAHMQSHLAMLLKGEIADTESGLPHELHIAAQALILHSYRVRGIGKDDLEPLPGKPQESPGPQQRSVPAPSKMPAWLARPVRSGKAFLRRLKSRKA